MVSRWCWELARDKLYRVLELERGFPKPPRVFRCCSQNCQFFSLFAFSMHGVGRARGANRAGRKESAQGICIASYIIERPCSRRDRRSLQDIGVLLCWVLPEQCWKTALLPGRESLCMPQLSVCYLRPRSHLLMC